MKELSIEEKAQRYDESIERARELSKAVTEAVTGVNYEYVFPELKEEEKHNGAIVLEYYREGDGFYKVNLAYLSKEQVKEIESIVKKWNHKPSELDEKIRKELIEHFRWNTQILNDFGNKRVIAWLEKQGQTFTKKDVDDAYLKGVCDTKHELEKQGEQKIVWSEDDEEMLNQVIEDVVKLAGPHVCYYKDINWLKSLKDRAQSNQGEMSKMCPTSVQDKL